MRKLIDDILYQIYWVLTFKLDWDYNNPIVKWANNHVSFLKLCSECCDFVSKYRDQPYSDDFAESAAYEWVEIFNHICKRLGYNTKSTELLFDSIGIDNNWEHLHMTEEEENKTSEEWFKDEFLADVAYCADRWTFGRLFRVQWAFCRWLDSIEKNEDISLERFEGINEA